jgi:hypothetical protein
VVKQEGSELVISYVLVAARAGFCARQNRHSDEFASVWRGKLKDATDNIYSDESVFLQRRHLGFKKMAVRNKSVHRHALAGGSAVAERS